MKTDNLPPFLKWPGGKRWLMSKYSCCFPKHFCHFYEPFLGGGAAFFYLNPTSATLSDVNRELISLYQVMRDNPIELAQAMKEHQQKHSKEYYYQIRGAQYDDLIQEASRFLYLNRMCYNGMYRVNRTGQFNVPIGTKTNCIYDIQRFQEYAERLKNTEIINCDFEDVISRAGQGDLIFADPPYTVRHNQSCFIKYNETLFTWNDQERLLEALISAKKRGAVVIATNVNFESLKQLYIDSGFFVQVLERYSTISGKAEKRCKQEELIISSKPFTGE